jgi:hypothetical protein
VFFENWSAAYVTSRLIAHPWKSATRQDLVRLRATISPHLPALLLEMDDIFLRRAGSSLESLWNELLALAICRTAPMVHD